MVKASRPLLLQVRAAVLNGDLPERLTHTAETGPSIEDRVDVRTDTAVVQGGLANTPTNLTVPNPLTLCKQILKYRSVKRLL